MTDMPRPKVAHIWPRSQADFYVEPAWCARRLFEVEPFTGLIWDPACGLSTIPKAARTAGLSSYGSDIAEDAVGTQQDFLTASPLASPFSVVTNPPFKLARKFAERALNLNATKVGVLFPVACMNAASRWLIPLQLARVWLLTPRPSMPPGELILRGEKPQGGRVDYCWLVFDRGYAGWPQMGWLHRDPVVTSSVADAIAREAA
jgi:hypothetical protein